MKYYGVWDKRKGALVETFHSSMLTRVFRTRESAEHSRNKLVEYRGSWSESKQQELADNLIVVEFEVSCEDHFG